VIKLSKNELENFKKKNIYINNIKKYFIDNKDNNFWIIKNEFDKIIALLNFILI
jgi:hypothetical protein